MHIDQMLEMFRVRYGRRNQLCFPYGLHELLQLMGQSFAKLNRLIRRNDAPEIVGIRLADAVAWLCAVVNYFDDLPFAEAFIAKYSKMECLRCEERSCTCDPEDRQGTGKILLDAIPSGSHGKTLSWWCHHLDNIFGSRNREEGIYRVVAHLIEEMHEVLLLTSLTVFEPNDLDELEKQFALELADVLAHLIAIANLKKIDLTVTIQSRYGDHCPTCLKASCQCPRLTIVKGETRHIGSVSD